MTQILPFDVPGGSLFALLFGLALLLAGRRIFWLVVGVFGFLFAYDLAQRYLGARTEGLELIVALLAGLAGIVLAIFLQKVAVGLAGFLLGCYVALGALGSTGGAGGTVTAPELALVLIVGVVCAVLALWLFETALILLSSLAGAALIGDSLDLEPASSLLAFAILVVVGVAVQTGIGPRRRRRRRLRAADD
jgi:hypothetical protein